MTIGSKIIFFENLPSTNTYAAGLLRKEEVPDGTVVRAAFQSAGRGQTGNTWESKAGKNLLFSIIIQPGDIPAGDQFLISMMISLGITDFLQHESVVSRIKWPNDIYVNNDKIAGILIENSIIDDSILNSIAGIGLNVNQEEFPGNAPNPISMKMITGHEYDTDACFANLIDAIDKRYLQLKRGEYAELRKEYRSRLFRLNEWNDFRESGKVFRGRILSVADDGLLEIETTDPAVRQFSFREVDFIL